MKPRYAIINTEDRDEFERNWHLPYGYNNTLVSCNFDFVLNEFHKNFFDNDPNYVIEKYDNGIREVVYPL